MSKARTMGAGLAGSFINGVNINQIQFGHKLQGLASSTGHIQSNNVRSKSYGNKRNVVFNINQLNGLGRFYKKADGNKQFDEYDYLVEYNIKKALHLRNKILNGIRTRVRNSFRANEPSAVYFTVDYDECNNPSKLVDGSIADFTKSPGRFRASNSYINIKQITATIDLTSLTSLSEVNAAFYMIQQSNTSADYCDSGGNGNCGEIDFLETNGNGIFQSTIHFPQSLGASNPQIYEYTWTGASSNSNIVLPTSYDFNTPGTHEASGINFSNHTFYMVIDFITTGSTSENNLAYTGMTIKIGQNVESELTLIFNGTGAEGSSSTSYWDSITSTMQSGWVPVCSYWQGWVPKGPNNEWWAENEAWSSLCGSVGPKFSNVMVTAEAII